MSYNPEQRATLLLVARRSVEAAVCGAPTPQFAVHDPALTSNRGAFVTIKTLGRLRGCIGHFEADRPLCEMVADMAAASATQDPRFTDKRLEPHEVCDCHLEISVLLPLEPIADPLDFKVGVHGIYVRSGGQVGCFLPQVGSEAGWTAEEMLTQCCTRKAGLTADAWRKGEVEVFRFTAEVIEEPHLETKGK